jgi:protein AaeX
VIGEIHILGLFAPASLVSAIAAGLMILLLRRTLARAGFYRHVWHPGLFDLALYIVLWTAAAALVDHLQPNRLVLSW